MIRLAIIFFLIPMVRNDKICNFTIDDFNKLRQLFNDSERYMEEATQSQSGNAVIVIGNGRGGKSTLINYLMGNALEAYQLDKYYIKIRKANESISGPEIGTGSLSNTSIPSKWNSIRPELKNLDIWDSAGFMDNRGPIQDLNNSFYLYHLTRKVENLKFILLIDYNDIDAGNVDQISNVFSILEKYLTHRFKIFFPSMSVIISKTPKFDYSENPIDNEYICDGLQDKLLSNPKLSISNVSKDFIQHIINNNQSLALFRAAEEEGNLTSEIDVNIFPAINSCKRIIKSCHQDIGVPLSSESELSLKCSSSALLFIDKLVELEDLLFKSFNKKFDAFCQSDDNNTLQANKAELNRIGESFNTYLYNNANAEVKLHVLETISDDLKNFIKSKEVLNIISLTMFTDFLLRENKMGDISSALNNLIKSIKVQIHSLVPLCLMKLKEITDAQYRKKQEKNEKNKNDLLKTVNDTISKLNEPEEELGWWQKFLRILKKFLGMNSDNNI